MNFLKNVASMAQTAIESINNPKHLTPDQLVQETFSLPPSEHIISEIDVDYVITSRVLHFLRETKTKNSYLPIPKDVNLRILGKMTLTNNFLLVKRADADFEKIVFHIATIEKVHKVPNIEVVQIRLLTHNGMILDVLCDTVKSKAEYFWHLFAKQMQINKSKAGELDKFQLGLYSEYLISKNCKASNLGEKHLDVPIHPKGGLGLKYKFPGNQSRENEVSKLKRWFEFFRRYGRNLEIVKNKIFTSLILIGIPNRLRGEIWELTNGAMYLRFENMNEYDQLLSTNENSKSLAIDEIEKDLNRSLPEYPAFQSKEGIDKLRRVLTAYSWKNPEIGYCQAMNIVTAALLIFMTEEQAYWTLSVLCDRLIPGYYSKTMYGVLLDQKVLEGLMKKSMPAIGDHFTNNDIQLSIVSLPWFLSFFLNSMPLVYAFRVIDGVFLNGIKTLFQVALAISKVNSHSLLKCRDDGECIAIFKDYFASLDEVDEINEGAKKKFDMLWEVALNDFKTVLELAEDLIFITTPWREGLIFDSIANRELEDSIAEKIVQRRQALISQGVEIDDNTEITLPDEVKFDEEKWKAKQSVRYLSASSSFLQLAFKYAQPYENPDAPLIDLSELSDNKEMNTISHNVALNPNNKVYITPSMFRMVILANETYSSFFENQFWQSFDLDSPASNDQSVFGGMIGNIRGMVNNVMADGARVANQVKKKMDDARTRADTVTSLESGSSSLISSKGSNLARPSSNNNRGSVDSRGADSMLTSWTLDSGEGDQFDYSNLEDLNVAPDQVGLLAENEEKEERGTEGTSLGRDTEDNDDFGSFIPAQGGFDSVNEITKDTSELNL
ncbi:hypothetical protein CANINC_002492 [Pichia inconspicua]|uniref:Rab-GAP TBC domain-containing protein n=1 Tax=Pichia inconspicua TaxID=52247 RepID=A0A4T0X0T2_9ASCO|nr:hypothetical protein CANINC_002492 [[Candida] inconspicua]